jgi:peptidoglycan-associated lipoprotein
LFIFVLFIVSCSQNSLEVPQTSEESLNKIDRKSSIDKSKGNYLEVAGNKEFVSNIYFEFDKYSLDENGLKLIKSNALKLLKLKSNIKIKLEGNSDEFGTDEYNYALALKRAKSVKDILVKNGIKASSITIFSYGEINPVCKDKTKGCWSKNRRVEHKLIP